MKCPTCNKPVAREGNPFRPFCSERCKLLDFGAWVNEEYGVPSDEAPVFEETPPGHPAPGDSSDRAPNS